ncbi:hypothetical protein [Devosia sp. Naph2]|uniref:hypothetical protein n=1 Tax=Devosia polycyclovorans TaxID=3345148 RepID=UPI0035CF001C
MGKQAMDFDVHGLARAFGCDDDLVDHGAQGFEDGVAGLSLADAIEVAAQLGDELAVAIGGSRMQDDRFVVSIQAGGLFAQLLPLGLEAAQAIEQGIGNAPSHNQVDKAVNLLVEICQPLAQ